VRALFGRPDLVVSDLDGTLVPSTLEFSAAIMDGVARLRQAGVPFIICTGRMLRSARRMAAQLGIESGLIVCYQGALVADLGSGEWLLHRPVPPHLAAEVVAHMRAIGRHLNAYIHDDFYVEEMDEWARRYAEYAQVACNVVDDLRVTVQATPPTKLLVATDPDDAAVLLPQLQERWRGTLYVTRSLPQYIEITGADATKSAALGFVSTRLGVRREHTVACGDSLNDIDMLQWAGLGVAVAEGAEAARKAADLVMPRDELGGLFAELAAGV
jgi:Cof subfamily protein (haloacid dehalogenase superfamily)